MKMMHHPNMHHQPMSGHPPQHMGGHQGMPGHHQMPPHQMHRENRHVLTRVPLGPSQAGAGMGGMGAAMGVPHHAPAQRPPHPIRAMPHHPQAQHHNVPPQQMKPLRRPYMGGGYGPGGGMMHSPYPQPHHQPAQPAHTPHHTGLRLPASVLKMQARLNNEFVVSSAPSTSTTTTSSAKIPEASANASANVSAGAVVSANTSASTGAGASVSAGAGASTGAPPSAGSATADGGGAAAAGDGEAARPAAAQANSKEKTPMCLVNELARYNKIKHQYRLTSETGPAHKKVFTVTLRLGDAEEYTAEGSSIKRAQHAAASAALAATAYPPPPPRAHPAHHPAHPHHRHSVMPTVELNALAMKLCQPAVYTSIPAVAAATPCAAAPGVAGVAGVHGMAGMGGVAGPARGAGGRGRAAGGFRAPLVGMYGRVVAPTLVYRVRVTVGGRAWLGEGATPQAARHDAAARALRDLRPPLSPHSPNSPHSPLASAREQLTPTESDTGETGGDPLNGEVKSPVSLVHELALKRNLTVQFTVKSERGPPHMRVFVTVCCVGDMETEGEGNGKKVSKRRAAERMLDEMRRRWPAALLRARAARPDKRNHPAKKKPRNLIKEGESAGGAGGAGGAGDNPISVLAVARHVARARSPQYRVLEERGAARRREFLVRCDAPPHSATGLGPNKKTAKRRAAHNVLIAMELSANNANEANTTAPAINSNVTESSVTTTDTKVITTDTKQKEGDPNADPRQPVPGVLLMDYQRNNNPLHNGVSETPPAAAGGTTPGAKDQLLYLSQLLGFTVQFSDFPKRNHGEYLSLVSLSTEPPVMCHGGGSSTAHSHEQCSRAALRALALMGLDAPTAPADAPPAPATAIPGLTSSSAKSTAISNGIAD